MLKLSEIFIYPIKSLGGISLQQSTVEEKGLKYDRRMMLVDKTGMFLTQRNYPQMALLKTSMDEDFIKVIDRKSGLEIKIFPHQTTNEKTNVIIWEDNCSALKVSAEADEFFSDTLRLKCHLVLMPEDEKRVVDRRKKYIKENHIVSFADAYPFLVIGQSSLNDLNKRLLEPLPMNRFRPNFVFTGGDAFEEDNWKDFKIGYVKFKAVKPCARCVITTTNQETAERNEEPLKTLAAYRNFGNKVLFGMNVISNSTGNVFVGDELTFHKK